MTEPDHIDPLVYISIVNWNARQLTLNCLGSLQQLDYPNYRIILVDNHSTDGTIEAVRQSFPETEILAADENLGFAGGHQIAVTHALAQQADLIWLLNTDAETEPDALTQLVGAYREHGDHIYGSVILKGKNDPVVEAGYMWQTKEYGDPKQALDHNYTGTRYADALKHQAGILEIGSIAGSSFMIPVNLIRQYGFMDPSYFLYMEELDYCLRLKTHGIKSFLVPGSVIYHQGKGSTQDNPKLQQLVLYYRRRNFIRIAKNHYASTHYRKVIRTEIWVGLKSFIRNRFQPHDPASMYYSDWQCLGVLHALLGKKGKTLAPERYV